MRTTIWTIDTIGKGIERYYAEHEHYPTANDFDECAYLPSARQIQRKFGGLEALRTTLGLAEANYTKGDLRRAVFSGFSPRALAAEDQLEVALIKHFGEPYVHTQKRYYRLMKNRWDFFVYYRGGYFGIDIFSTSRRANIMNNIRHKLIKYADVPPTTKIFFIVDAPELTDNDIRQTIIGSKALAQHLNITVILLETFLATTIHQFQTLDLPDGVKLVLQKNIEQK